MKALTLFPEHVELFRLGIRTIETRGWRAPEALIGQRIAIHAGARDPDSAAARRDPISRRAMAAIPHGDPITRGAIVLTARLADCVPIHEQWCRCDHQPGIYALIAPSSMQRVDIVGLFEAPSGRGVIHPDWSPSRLDVFAAGHPRQQAPFGDFRCGNFAWLLDDTVPTTERCPWCLGDGGDPDDDGWQYHGITEPGSRGPCPVCRPDIADNPLGKCPPIPARGRQRLWNWEPGA